MFVLRIYEKVKKMIGSFPAAVLWLAMVIAVTEFLLMLVLAMQALSPLVLAVVDSLVLTAVISPLLYLYVAKRQRPRGAPQESRKIATSVAAAAFWLLILIGVAEFLIMLVLNDLEMSTAGHAAADSLILAAVVAPVLYLHLSGRQRMERELQESQEKYKTLFEGTLDGVVVVDETLRILLANQAAASIIGFDTVEELLAVNPFDLVPQKEVERALSILTEDMFEKDLRQVNEFRLINKAGEEVWISAVGTLTEYEGKPAGLASFRDITERRQAEESLQESEGRFRSLVNNVRLGIFRSTPGPTGKFLEVNPAMEEITGYSREELLRMAVSDLYVHPEAREAVLEEIASATGKVTKELSFRKKDGREIIVSDTKFPVRDSGGEILYFDGILEDITERKQMERELQEKNKQLDGQNEELQRRAEELMARQQELMEKTEEVAEANRLKSEFLAHMSHELRTPLNVIIGFSELLTDEVPGAINDKQKQCLSDILESGQHLLGLIDDVLDLSKIESGKMGFERENVALTKVIESLTRTMMPILRSRKQSLDVQMEEGLPLVYASEGKLGQVLLNLVDNSSKVTPDGGKLTIEAVSDGDWCRVSVIDNGIGIKKEDQERIFEPFCQLENPLTRRRGGTGLGLVLVKQIVERYGGRVWVESDYGKGSRFTFTLPLARNGQPKAEWKDAR